MTLKTGVMMLTIQLWITGIHFKICILDRINVLVSMRKKLKYNKIVVILTGSVILNNSNCLFYLFCPSVKEDLRAFRYTD